MHLLAMPAMTKAKSQARAVEQKDSVVLFFVSNPWSHRESVDGAFAFSRGMERTHEAPSNEAPPYARRISSGTPDDHSLPCGPLCH